MEIKAKKSTMILSVFIVFFGVMGAYREITLGEDVIFPWMIILAIPLELVFVLFLLPTFRLFFSEKGIKRYWKIGIGRYILWEENRYSLQWNNVTSVFSVLPLWLPIKMIGVGGRTNRRYLVFFVGTYTTQKKDAIIYIVNHVKTEVISNDVKKIVKKYN